MKWFLYYDSGSCLLNLDEVKAWINSEAQYTKIEKRLK